MGFLSAQSQSLAVIALTVYSPESEPRLCFVVCPELVAATQGRPASDWLRVGCSAYATLCVAANEDDRLIQIPSNRKLGLTLTSARQVAAPTAPRGHLRRRAETARIYSYITVGAPIATRVVVANAQPQSPPNSLPRDDQVMTKRSVHGRLFKAAGPNN